MHWVILLAVLSVAAARPGAVTPAAEVIPIVRNDVVSPNEKGDYSVDVETGNGIVLSEAGKSSGPDGAIESQGKVSFTHPDGTPFALTYVANAQGGFQPQSDALPVAPVFPFEIPQFVLDQIAFAEKEDANRPKDPARGDYVGF